MTAPDCTRTCAKLIKLRFTPSGPERKRSDPGFFSMTKDERSELDTALAADGLRLRGNSIIRTHDGPMMLPCEPVVVVEDITLSTPDLDDSQIPY